MPAVIEISPDTREILIRALRAYRVHAAKQLKGPIDGPDRVPDEVPAEAVILRAIDDTVEDLITGRARLLRGTDAAWRELGVTK